MAWLIPVMAGFFGLAALAGPAGGIALLLQGELRGLPFVLVPLALATLMVGLNVAGLRSLERNIPKLIQEMNDVLDSAATFHRSGCMSGRVKHHAAEPRPTPPAPGKDNPRATPRPPDDDLDGWPRSQ